MRTGPTTSAPGGRAPEDDVPRVLGRYRLVRRLGAGGFGTVWKARDEHLHRDVAVKILPRERVIEGRFEREALAAARLAHPAVVTLFEAATDEEGAYLVSELVTGTTLEQALTRGRLSDRAVLDIGVELCDALAHAHLHGVVHRDVKPSNILVPSRPASGAAAKLTDFGVARVFGGATLTSAGERVGTAAYMAPEQAEGREAGEAADLYSLALVLYEGLTGVNPVPDLLARPHARRLALRLPPLRRQRRDLPRGLGAAIDLALRPDPSERGSVGELRAALVGARSELSDAPGIVEGPREREPPRSSGRRPRAEELPHGEPARREDPWRAGPPRDGAEVDERDGAATRPLVRALAALAAAGLAVWMTRVMPHPTVPAATVGLAAALGVLVLPRLAWAALGVASVAGLLAAGRPGLAALVLVLAALPAALLPRAGTLWPLGALAPALGVLGVAGGWPAVAARAGGPVRSAGLALLGWAWLWVGSAFAGHGLFARAPAHLAAAKVWGRSPAGTLHHVITPLLTPGLLAGGAAWGIAALLLHSIPALSAPRSRPFPLVLTAALAWSAATAVATGVALDAVGDAALRPSAATLLVGVLVSCAALCVPRAAASSIVMSRRTQRDGRLA